MDENLVKGFKLKNGDSYKYDYEALGNKPFYNIITVGDVIIPETTCYFEEDDYECAANFTVPQSILDYPFELGKNYLLYIDDTEYIVYPYDYNNLFNFYGVYNDIYLGSNFPFQFYVGSSEIYIVGEHTIKLCSIASEHLKQVDIKNSIVIKEVTEDEHTYFVTEKNLVNTDFLNSYVRLNWNNIMESVYSTQLLDDGTSSIYFLSPASGPQTMRYNPDSGIAVLTDSASTYNTAYNLPTNLSLNDFRGAVLFYDGTEQEQDQLD